MADIVIFGGTTEGRELAAFCSLRGEDVLVSVATWLGKHIAPDLPHVTYHVGRLDQAGVTSLMRDAAPRLVIDATHPYATVVTRTVAACCADLKLPYVRVRRTSATTDPTGDNFHVFPDVEAVVSWLNGTSGVIFSTTGAKEAAALVGVRDYQDRVVLRLLPVVESVETCLKLGYPSRHLVAMQGPFDHDLNVALFRHFDAAILVTKESGDIGGFDDKITAARDCGMACAVIARPAEADGLSLDDVKPLIERRAPRPEPASAAGAGIVATDMPAADGQTGGQA